MRGTFLILHTQHVAKVREIRNCVAQAAKVVPDDPATAPQSGGECEQKQNSEGLHTSAGYEALLRSTTANASREGGVFRSIGALTERGIDGAPPIPVFLFQTVWQMRDFLDRDTPMDVSQMDQFSGSTWFNDEHPAMATSVEDQSLHSVCSALQHELFHCWEYPHRNRPTA